MQKFHCGCAFSGTGTQTQYSMLLQGMPNSVSFVEGLQALMDPWSGFLLRDSLSFFRSGMEKDRSVMMSAWSGVMGA